MPQEYIFEKFDGLENADHRTDPWNQDYMEVIVGDTPYMVYSHICPSYPDGGLIYVWWNAGREMDEAVYDEAEAAFQAFIKHIDWSDLRVEGHIDEGRWSTDAEAFWGLRIVRDVPAKDPISTHNKAFLTCLYSSPSVPGRSMKISRIASLRRKFNIHLAPAKRYADVYEQFEIAVAEQDHLAIANTFNAMVAVSPSLEE